MRIESDTLKTAYQIDPSWCGPHDEDDDCVFNIGVGCPLTGRVCNACGHNPLVAYHRIATSFGEAAAAALTVRVE